MKECVILRAASGEEFAAVLDGESGLVLAMGPALHHSERDGDLEAYDTEPCPPFDPVLGGWSIVRRGRA